MTLDFLAKNLKSIHLYKYFILSTTYGINRKTLAQSDFNTHLNFLCSPDMLKKRFKPLLPYFQGVIFIWIIKSDNPAY